MIETIINELEAALVPKTHCHCQREAETHPHLLKLKPGYVVITGRCKTLGEK